VVGATPVHRSTCCPARALESLTGMSGPPGFLTVCTVAEEGTTTSSLRPSLDWCWRIGQALTLLALSRSASGETAAIVPRSSSVNGVPRGAANSRCWARLSQGYGSTARPPAG
jgi:hypothetical protein